MSTEDSIRKHVREVYAQIARQAMTQPQRQSSCCGGSTSCCGREESATESCYTEENLSMLSQDILTTSLGCGDPIALAELRPGETVLDLGSGGGLDCLLAAKRVGPAGRVIGVDMTPEMLSVAWRNAARAGVSNVDFRYGTIEQLPVASESVDVVISNCVINLSPNKPQTFREIVRVLKPGGRVSVSDIVLMEDLPPVLRSNAALYASCVAGALLEDEYIEAMRSAGLENVEVSSRTMVDPAGYTDDPEIAAALEDVIASVRIVARKPAK